MFWYISGFGESLIANPLLGSGVSGLRDWGFAFCFFVFCVSGLVGGVNYQDQGFHLVQGFRLDGKVVGDRKVQTLRSLGVHLAMFQEKVCQIYEGVPLSLGSSLGAAPIMYLNFHL